MGLFSRLLDTEDNTLQRRSGWHPAVRLDGAATDREALERYRYMIQTAPPETIEQAHAAAFERLTSEQRRQLWRALARVTPLEERAALSRAANEPRTLARAATRAEVRDPGVIERTLAQSRVGFGAGLLSSFAAGFAGSLAARAFLATLEAGEGAAAGERAAAPPGPDDAAAQRSGEHDLVEEDGSFDLSEFEI
jgi:hypothetical protein